MDDESYHDIIVLRNMSIDLLTEEELEAVYALTEAVKKAISDSKHSVDPNSYFIWMYGVQPFAEA